MYSKMMCVGLNNTVCKENQKRKCYSIYSLTKNTHPKFLICIDVFNMINVKNETSACHFLMFLHENKTTSCVGVFSTFD